MKKIASFFMVLTFVSSLYAFDGKELFQSRCTSCHGTSGEKKALGTGNILKGQSAAEIEKKLLGYKNGTYGGSKKNIMKNNADKLSDEEIKKLSEYIGTLK